MSVTCDRCDRKVHPWPLQRPGGCSPDYWAYCIRNDEAIMEKINKAVGANYE